MNKSSLTGRTPSLKLNSRLEYQKQVEVGTLPDFLSGLENITGRRLNDKELDDIEAFSYEDKSDLRMHVGLKFLYKGSYRVSMNLITDELNPYDLVELHNLRVMNIMTGITTLYDKSHIETIRDSDFMGDGPVANFNRPKSEDQERSVYFPTKSKASDPKGGYHNPRRPRSGGRFETTKHDVSYNKTSGYVECSCLYGNARWCRAIMEQVEKGVDIPVVDQAIKHLGYNSNLKQVDVNLPVMPRTILRLKLKKYKMDVPGEPGSYTEEYRFECGDYIRVWWEEGMSLRALTAEAFAMLKSSNYSKEWAERVSQAKYCLENPRSGRIKFLCQNKWHDWKKDELLYTMVSERMNDGSSPIEMQRNMAYLATLFAFYDMYEGRCYSCFVGFQPENDVPEI